jgi:signal transduction histidine kinase
VATRPPLTKRFGRAQWMAIDAVVAVGMFAALIALGRHHHVSGDHPVMLAALAALASLPLAVRRRWPLQVLAIVLAASVTFGVLRSATSTVTSATYVLYTVAVQVEPRWRALLALLAVEAGVIISFALTTSATSNPANAALTGLAQLTVWIVGDSVRRHRAYAASEREQSVRQALTEQRLQIARELHDIVAHAMSVVAVQAGVGAHVIATRPDQAAKTLDAIEVTARSALTETRHLLGILRDDADAAAPASLVPSPGIGNLSALVERFAAAGLPVTLTVEGQARPLSPGLELSAYRIVQEALTNVVRHARQPTQAAAVIRYQDDGVVVEVTDDGQGEGGPARARAPGAGSAPSEAAPGTAGHGLTGMRERASVFGGEFRAGSRPEGGFRVVARLPAGSVAE